MKKQVRFELPARPEVTKRTKPSGAYNKDKSEPIWVAPGLSVLAKALDAMSTDKPKGGGSRQHSAGREDERVRGQRFDRHRQAARQSCEREDGWTRVYRKRTYVWL